MAIISAAVENTLYHSFRYAKEVGLGSKEYNINNNLYNVFAVSKIIDDDSIEIPFLAYNYIKRNLNDSILKNSNEIATHIGNLSTFPTEPNNDKKLLLYLLDYTNRKSLKISKFLSKDGNLYIGGNLCILYDNFTPLFLPTMRVYYSILNNQIVFKSTTLVIYTSPNIYFLNDYIERYIAKKIIPYLMQNYNAFVPAHNIEIVTTDYNPNFICKVDNNPNIVISNIMDNESTKILLDNMNTITSTICL